MKKYIVIFLLIIWSCNEEQEILKADHEEFYENVISLCNEGNCPDAVVCSLKYNNIHSVIYVYNSEYYEIKWSVLTNEFLHNNFPLEKEEITRCIE